MTDKEAELGNEHQALSSMVDTDGWKLVQRKWGKLIEDCEVKLRGMECENRDWYAGLISGYQRILQYPTKRMADIEKAQKDATQLPSA